MKRILIILTIALGTFSNAAAQRCVVGTNVPAGTTSRGLGTVKAVEKGSIRSVTGTVLGGDDRPVAEAIVEIFNRPEWIKTKRRTPPANQRRFIACRTGEDGRFSVIGLSKGVYELRISRGIPYDVTHVYVSINSAAKRRTLKVYLHLGD